MYDYDVLIIGSGPAGSKCAIDLGHGGKKVGVIEKGALGGVCLNRGCIPSKTYLHMVDILDTIKQAKRHGINIGDFDVSWEAAKKRKNQNVKVLGMGIKQLMDCAGAELIQGEASFVDAHTLKLVTEEDGEKKERQLTAEYIVIAVGSRPLFLPFMPKGEHVISATEVLDLEEIPESLVIIGGGVTGVEMASIFTGLGTKVTLIELQDFLLPSEDDEISELLKKSFEKKGADVLTSHKVKSCKDKDGGAEVIYETPDGEEKALNVDKALVVIGRVSNHDQFDLEKVGIETDGKGVKLDDDLRTTVPNIFVIGDSALRNLTAYGAEREASCVAELLIGGKRPIEYSHIPVTVFSHPEIGSIGMTEEAAIAKGVDYEIRRSHYAANAKAVIIGAREGMVKMVVDKASQVVLGVHIIGAHATDLIHQAFLPFMQKMTVPVWREVFWSHPVLSEVIKEALENEAEKAEACKAKKV